jgi:hypothetical protein
LSHQETASLCSMDLIVPTGIWNRRARLETIILPHELPGDLDFALLNQRLRAGEVQLDWSSVKEASETTLAVLLAGLDIAEDATALGLETVPEHLVEALSRTFEGAQARATRQTRPQVKQVQPPSLWTSHVQPDLFEEQETEEEELAEAEPVVDLPPPPRLLQAPPPVKLREELERLVLTDLLGPAGGSEEELDERNVRERYLIGMLAPSRRQVLPEEQDDLAVAGEDSSEEGRADTGGYAATFFPSSFGMTFCVSGDASRLHAWASWGRYQRIISETLRDEKSGNPKRVWKRQPMGEVAHEVALRIGPIEAWAPDPRQPEVVVRGLVRRLADTWIVTLFLINRQHEPKNLRDSAWIFQPELRVEAPDGTPIFCRQVLPARTKLADSEAAAEKEAMAMLYRNQVEFAAGHGVGVHVETLPGVPDRAVRITTRVAPTYEVPQTTSPTIEELPHLADLVLDMRALAETPDSDFARKLSPLTTAYAAWIAEQEERIRNPATGLANHRSAAEQAIAACTLTLTRIREGISLIETQPQAAEAFRFLNRAMWQQRIHTLAAEAVRRGNQLDLESVDIPANRTWRPFQLAFILINLPSLTNLHHPDRSEMPSALADLLWFPTGGGKTEAYLGLTAYTLAIRRLQGTIAGRSGEEGVAVLMRYTLRLLTLQQFQRAAALICACELIRREAIALGDHRWGKTPFRLGLWVGQRTTPNRTEQSAEAVKLDHGQFRRSSAFGGSGSPAQLTNCPWCGIKIEADQHIKVDLFKQGAGRTYMYCGDPVGNCPFSQRQAPDEGLPVLVVDEEIYRRLPSLLIATVDKFAQMPWNGAVGMLFGQVNGLCTRHGFRSPDLEDSDTHPRRDFWPAARTEPHAPLRPPDLIIQDELHLISGPLGTLVGLYEASVDRLASWDVDGQRVRPKVIASTATIRRASEQVRALFLRQVNIFPPHGLDIEDNFFSRQRPPSQSSPGRRYVGMINVRRIHSLF